MGKYKIGDRVKIKSWKQMEKKYGLNELGNINCACVFTKLMSDLCGGKYTIDGVLRRSSTQDVYSICGYDCVISEDMIDRKVRDKQEDFVSHPSHYTQGKIEVIDFIEDQKFGYRLGNAIKYICRCRFKGNKKQDLEKAIWYLQREIEKGE